jgi:hypothetical protein
VCVYIYIYDVSPSVAKSHISVAVINLITLLEMYMLPVINVNIVFYAFKLYLIFLQILSLFFFAGATKNNSEREYHHALLT